MNSAIYATTGKPKPKAQSYKGKKLKVTGPDGQVYRFVWTQDRQPTQQDMDWAVGEAKRMSEERPVTPSFADVTPPKAEYQDRPASKGPIPMAGRDLHADDPWKRPKGVTEQDIIKAEVSKVAKTATPAQKKLAKAQGGRTKDYLRGVAEFVGETITEHPITKAAAALERGVSPASASLGKKGMVGHAAGLGGAALSQNVKTGADLLSIVDPQSTLAERGEGVLGIGLDYGLPLVGSKVAKVVQKALSPKVAKFMDSIAPKAEGPGFDLSPARAKVPPEPPIPPSQTVTGAKAGAGSMGQMYHGTTLANAERIRKEGFKYGKGTGESAYLGGPQVEGIHLSRSAKDYDPDGTLGSADEVLAVDADPGKTFAIGIGDLGNIGDSPKARATWLRKNGYDSIEISYPDSTSELIILDPKRVRVAGAKAPVKESLTTEGPVVGDPGGAALNVGGKRDSDQIARAGRFLADPQPEHALIDPASPEYDRFLDHAIQRALGKSDVTDGGASDLIRDRLYKAWEKQGGDDTYISQIASDIRENMKRGASGTGFYRWRKVGRNWVPDVRSGAVKGFDLEDFTPETQAELVRLMQEMDGDNIVYLPHDAHVSASKSNKAGGVATWDNPPPGARRMSELATREMHADDATLAGLAEGAGANTRVPLTVVERWLSENVAGLGAKDIEAIRAGIGADEVDDVARLYGEALEGPKGKVPASHTTAHADVRRELGTEGMDAPPETVEGWIKDAEKLKGKEASIAAAINIKPRQLSKTEEVALGRRFYSAIDERDAAAAKGDIELYDALDEEAMTLGRALDASGSEWGRQGVARQIVLKNDYTDFGLKRRATKANTDIPLDAKQTAEVSAFAGRIQQLEGNMAKLREEVAAAIRSRTKLAVKGTPVQRRSAALGALRRLGLPTIEAGEKTVGIAVKAKKGSRAGAINIELLGADDKVRRAVRQLERVYLDEGAATLDDVVARLKTDIPGLTDDDALALLSDKYRALKLETDIAKVRADRFLREVRKQAVERQKPIVRRVGQEIFKELSSIQRALQTSFDIGGTFIQGEKAVVENPRAVGRAFVEQLKPLFSIKTQEAFDAHIARLTSDPMYARAKKAGIQFDDFGGSADFFGHEGLVQKIPGIFKSEAVFKAYKNQLRLEMFKSFAKTAPNDANHLLSAANLVNVMTGTAVGKPGEIARRFGGAFYAPSYEVSKWQYAMGQPLFDAAAKNGVTSKAFGQAAASYAKQAVAWIGIVQGLKYLGADIDTDIRSADFGKLTLPGGAQIEMFGKAYSPLRTVGQTFFSRISRAGNETKPDAYKESPIETFVTSKMAPLPKLGYDLLRKGTKFNYDTYEEEPISLGSTAKDMLPMGLKDVWKSWGVMGPLALISLSGIGTGEAKRVTPGKSPQSPLGLPRGIEKLRGNP